MSYFAQVPPPHSVYGLIQNSEMREEPSLLPSPYYSTVVQVESWQGGARFSAMPSLYYTVVQVESWQGGAKFAAKPSLSLTLFRDGFHFQGQKFRPFSDQVGTYG